MGAIDGTPIESLGPGEQIQRLRKRAFLASWNYGLAGSTGFCNACLIRNNGTLPSWTELEDITKETAKQLKLEGATMVLMAISEIAPPEDG